MYVVHRYTEIQHTVTLQLIPSHYDYKCYSQAPLGNEYNYACYLTDSIIKLAKYNISGHRLAPIIRSVHTNCLLVCSFRIATYGYQ